MFLYCMNAEGKRLEYSLAGRTSLTFGRSPEADVCVSDTKVSRMHAEIKPWDGDFVLKDLKSGNGTFVNEARITVTVLNPGDIIRVGSTEFHCVRESSKGTSTIVREVTEEIEQGKKGYRTILREIVESTETKPKQP